MHQAYCPLPRCTLTNDEIVQGHSRSRFSSHGPYVSYISWIRCLGVVWGWPNLQGCTGAMLGVADIGTGTGVTLGTVGVCGFGVIVNVVQQAEAVVVVQAWWVQAVVQKCEVWQESAV